MPRISLTNISAVGTHHNRNRTAIATESEDIKWIASAFGRQAVGASLVPSADTRGWYTVAVHSHSDADGE